MLAALLVGHRLMAQRVFIRVDRTVAGCFRTENLVGQKLIEQLVHVTATRVVVQ